MTEPTELCQNCGKPLKANQTSHCSPFCLLQSEREWRNDIDEARVPLPRFTPPVDEREKAYEKRVGDVAVTDYKTRLLAKMEELKAQYPQNGDHFDKHFIIQEVRKIVEEL